MNDYYPFGMLQPGRSYEAGTSYRYGFNGKENDNEVKGEGNQQDYGMRIYDPRLGRFLSVDPLLGKYPMLTPYQFASDRTIDGIDQDGKEWNKTETYDPKTGITSVHFTCNIKLYNAAATGTDAQAIGEAFKSSFAYAFDGVYDDKRKIQYSASATFEVFQGDETNGGDFNVILRDVRVQPGKLFIAGFNLGTGTQVNTVRAVAARIDPATGTIKIRTPLKVALSIVHEIGHTADVKHPFDESNTAKDVDLTPVTQSVNSKKINTNTLSPGADKEKVLSNIMMYPSTTIDGVPVIETIKDADKLNKFSPDQAYIILQQVNKDLNAKNSEKENKSQPHNH